MSNSQKTFIKLLEQQPITESYVSRIQLLVSKLVAESKSLTFKITSDLNAVQVSEEDTIEVENHKPLTKPSAELTPLKNGSLLTFPLSQLPFKLSDTYLTMQHVMDDKGNLYRFCTEGIFNDSKVTSHYELNLLGPFVWVSSSSADTPPRESRYMKRLRVVDNWIEAKRKELGLKPDSTPQDVHDRLRTEKGKELTQGWYWLEWHGINPSLFPVKYDVRNFFKQYKKISFGRGNR